MMKKSVGFLPRRRDISRDAFRAYYETRHAPLAVGLFPFRRYRRNHLCDDAAEPGFDCLSEFWVESFEAIGALMAGEVGETMRVDERNFMDQPAIRAGLATTAAEPPPCIGAVMLVRRLGGGDGALAATLTRAGAGVDLLAPFDSRGLPADAIVYLASPTAPSLPEGWLAGALLPVLSFETNPAELTVR